MDADTCNLQSGEVLHFQPPQDDIVIRAMAVDDRGERADYDAVWWFEKSSDEQLVL